jgi:hypothetical protein
MTARAKYLDDSGAVISGQGGGRIFATLYTSLLVFAAEATPLGLLDWYEYPFPTSGVSRATARPARPPRQP